VFDDGSDQEVRNSVRKSLDSERRVTLIFGEHTGLPGVGREEGVRRSNADWIAFLDSDDFWSPTKIEKQLDFADETSCRFICSNATKTKGGAMLGSYFSSRSVPDSINFKDMIRDNKVITSSVLVDRALLLKVGLFAKSHHVRAVEDYATWLRCSSIEKIGYMDLPLVSYEVSQDGLSALATNDVSIFAISDFIVWSRETKVLSKRMAARARHKALRAIQARFAQ
jgi:teichuronic acid biosynthesis glycosyltransferase TuaG